MEISETRNLLQRLKTYKQSFTLNASVLTEWQNVVEEFSYNDINSKLSEWLKSNSNNYEYPSPYELTRGLSTIAEKELNPHVLCPICGKIISLTTFDNHFDRCSSTEYLIRMNIKHFNRTFTMKDFNKLSDIQFWTKYWEFCYLLDEKLSNSNEKRCLANAVLTHKGGKPITTAAAIVEAMQ